MALINAYEIAKNWEKINGWSVSPGVSWCAKGNHVCIGEGAKVGARAMVGEWAKVGEGATVGEGAKVGARATVGEGAKVGARATVGEWAKVGARAKVGEGAKVGARATVGEWATVGEGATFIADLGCPQNTYRVCLVTVDDVAQVHAGCRKLSLSAAKDHWMKHSQPRAEYVACVAYAKELCKMKKIRITPNKKAGAK